MKFSTNSDDSTDESSEQTTAEKESRRASEQPGEHVTRAEYVQFLNDLRDDLKELDERLQTAEDLVDEQWDAIQHVRQKQDDHRQVLEEHEENFESAAGAINRNMGNGKVEYEKSETLTSEESAETAEADGSSE